MIFALLFLLAGGNSKPVISASTRESIAAGSTVQFKASIPVKWSLAPGTPGTIDESGTYHAPAHVPVHNQLGGCPVLPNDHIYNTRIDSLPVNAKSSEWFGFLPNGKLNYYQSWGTNIADSGTPKQSLHFMYTPGNDGKYEVPAWPELKRENGVFTGVGSGVDRHVITVDRESCHFFEIYDNYSPGENNLCPSCTAQGGASYAGNSYALPQGSSDAAGLLIAPLTIRLDEVRSGVIKHAARFTLSNNFIAPSSVWPSTAHAGPWGKIPYGTRFRLKRDFAISTFSPAAQVLLAELKEYGLILADGGANWEIQTSTDLTLDPTVDAALLEIRSRGPNAQDLEAVDESGLMISQASGKISQGGVDSTVTVIATDISNPANSTSLSLPLQPVTVGVPAPSIWIQSGVQTQMKAWVNGSNDKSVKWSMSPKLGNLTPDGVYLAPAVTRPTATLLTAASERDPESKATVAVTVMPPGEIRVKVGNATRAPDAPKKQAPDYGPDSEGHMWWRDQAGEVSWGVANDDWHGNPWPNEKDISLYYTSRYSKGDMVYSFLVPNGNYKISLYFARPGCKGHFDKDTLAPIHIETQGKIVFHNFDFGAQVDHTCQMPEIQSIPAQVKDNSLYFALRRITLPKIQPVPLFNGYSIAPDNSSPHLTIDPVPPKELEPGDSFNFYAVGWSMSNDVNWSVTGAGSIGEDGFYQAPVIPSKSPTKVTVTARSKVDNTQQAIAAFELKPGVMTIEPASASTSISLSQGFKVLLGHAEYKNVQWSVSPAVGSISAAGVFTAPDYLSNDMTVLVTARSKDVPDQAATASVTIKATLETIRIRCGEGGAFKDAQGNLWEADRGYSPGTVQNTVVVPISGAPADMQTLYQSSRYRYTGEPFSYSFPVPNGRYSVTLKFADNGKNPPGVFSFDVKLNGVKVLSEFDPNQEHGSRWAVDKTFQTKVTNKTIKLDFLAYKTAAFINGIEIRYLGR